MKPLPTTAIISMALFTTPALAQEQAPSPPAVSAEMGLEGITFCAALQTFAATTLSISESPDTAMQSRLTRSATRWLEHAATLPPKDKKLVIERYRAWSRSLTDLVTGGLVAEEDAQALAADDQRICAEAEREIFGNSYMDL